MKKSFIRPKKTRELRAQRRLTQQSEQKLQEKVHMPVYADLDKNVAFLKKILGKSGDIISRRFIIPHESNREAVLFYIDGMADSQVIDDFILHSLTVEPAKVEETYDIAKWLKDRLIHVGEVTLTTEMKKIVAALLFGDTIIFIDQCEQGIVIGTKGWEHRSVSEPNTEAVVRGSREGFIENMRTNTALIRRRLQDPDLRFDSFTVGKRTKTHICLAYVKGIINADTLSLIRKRIENIDIDGVLESGYVEEFIEDNTWSPFPQLQATERPDSVVAHLLEGKAAIIVDGTPFALVLPAVFSQFYYSPEDYYNRFLIASLVRLIRFISFFIALLLPAFYIAFVSFHTEMIPSKLAIAIAAGRATVPFSTLIEALLMEFSVEILREASIRLPGPIGPTIGIVGALVIGDAAVSAGIVSPLMVIVVALTTIGSYTNPNYGAATAVRMLRFPLMIAAAIAGLYGTMFALLIIVLHLVKLKSFGVPYLAPMSPLKLSDMKDSIVRVPWKWMNVRPKPFKTVNELRQEQTEPQEEKR